MASLLKNPLKNGKPITDPTSGYDPEDPYKNRDARLDQTVLHNGSQWKGATIETFEGGNANLSSNNDRSRTSYGLKKFMDGSLIDGSQTYQGQDNNWIFLRYGEVLLNYAESQNEAVGPDASVYNALNLIRARAGLPGLPAGISKDEMRDRITHFFHPCVFSLSGVTAISVKNIPSRGMFFPSTF